MIPFVVATSLASSSSLHLENESQIKENVPLLNKNILLKERKVQSGLYKNVANKIVGTFLTILLDSRKRLLN